jgi:Ni,Fe-hydrogenase III component G
MSLEDHFASLVQDNVRKNKVEAILADIVPEISETVQDTEKRSVKQLRKPLEHRYLPDRVLEVKLPDDLPNKKSIEAEIHLRLQEFGKVVVI